MRHIFLILIILSTVSCTTTKKSVMLGAASGAGVGATSGLLLGKENKSKAALISAGVGALVGGVASYFIHNGLEDRDAEVRKKTLFNLDSHGITDFKSFSNAGEFSPLLSNPQVEEKYIDWHVDGSELHEGHRVWKISEQPQWMLPENKPSSKKKNKK